MNTENYKIVNVEGTTSKFKASIKVGFKNEEDIIAFIKNYAIKREYAWSGHEMNCDACTFVFFLY